MFLSELHELQENANFVKYLSSDKHHVQFTYWISRKYSLSKQLFNVNSENGLTEILIEFDL